MERLREIELMLIENTARSFDEQEKDFFLDLIRKHFPDLTEAELREALDS